MLFDHRKKSFRIFILMILCLWIGIIKLYSVDPELDQPVFRRNKGDIEQVKAADAMKRLSKSLPDYDSSNFNFPYQDFQTYLEFYHLDFSDAEHDASYFQADYSGSQYNQKIFIHEIRHTFQSRGVVLIVHGYLDHSANSSDLCRLIYHAGYDIVLFDLPGHGLSYGERASIGHFDDYRRVIDGITEKIVSSYQGTKVVIAYSTGGALVIDDLFRGETVYEKAVLLAPLIRWQTYGWSVIGYRLFHHFIWKVPSFSRDISSDEDYKKFKTQRDPVPEYWVPLNWVGAMIDWNHEISSIVDSPQKEVDVFIVQGNCDVVVDWKHNINFLQRNLKGIRIKIIDGAKHQLINETEEIRKLYESEMIAFINNSEMTESE